MYYKYIYKKKLEKFNYKNYCFNNYFYVLLYIYIYILI